MTVHKKLLINWKVFNRIWWSWCYYNGKKRFYPARWKKITVNQSKVQKNRLFRYFWATRYSTKIIVTSVSYFTDIERHTYSILIFLKTPGVTRRNVRDSVCATDWRVYVVITSALKITLIGPIKSLRAALTNINNKQFMQRTRTECHWTYQYTSC